ncbi:MAG: TlpA family protein disulfide reductase [Limnochordales bacterium]
MGRVGFVVIRVGSILRWSTIIAAILAAGLLLYGLLGPMARPSLVPVAALPLDRPAPDFTLADWSGQPVALSAYKGRPVLLVFWTSWCPGCPDGLSDLDRLYRQYRDSHGLVLLAVNIMETRAAVETVARERGWAFPILLDTDGAVSSAYLVRIAPTVMFIDTQGILRDRLQGELERDIVLARLQPLLPREPLQPTMPRPELPVRATGLTLRRDH